MYDVINKLTEREIGPTIKVQKNLGPDFLKSVYQSTMVYELNQSEIPFEKEKSLCFLSELRG